MVSVNPFSAQLDTMRASPQRRGRKMFGTCDPKLDVPLRRAARLLIEGKAKSGRDALIKVLGAGNRQFDTLYKRWNRKSAALLRQAERVREIEAEWKEKGCGHGQVGICSYHPDKSRDLPTRSYALINQNSTDWNASGWDGWHSAEHFGHDEALIRRDLWGVMSAEEFEASEEIHRWSCEIASIAGGC